MTATPSIVENQMRPSGALVTCGWYNVGWENSRRPSALSNTVTCSIRGIAGFSSFCGTRSRPHGVYSHIEPASSGIDQWTPSHGNPLPAFTVVTRPSLIRLKPLRVAAQTVPSRSARTSYTMPVPRPSRSAYRRSMCRPSW